MNDEPFAKALGAVLRHERQRAGHEQADFGKVLGITASGYSRVETGVTKITVVQLRKLSRVLKIEAWKMVEEAERLTALGAKSSGAKR